MQPALKAVVAAPVRLMIVDDSAIVRGFTARIFQDEPEVEIVATCSNGEIALREIQKRPCDVVILDIEMPVMDGLTVLPKLIAVMPGVKVLMSSTLTQRNAEISLEALSKGAADYVPKPSTKEIGGSAEFRRVIVEKVKALGRRKPPAARRAAVTSSAAAKSSIALRAAQPRKPQILVIGSSTGGPQALMTLLRDLPRDFALPIIIAQHMPQTFTTILAQHLARAAGRPGAEAVDGEAILPGHVYLAPGGLHLELARDGVTLKAKLNQAPPENFCRPSVNPLFRSAARLFVNQPAAVLPTGMDTALLDGAPDITIAGAPLIAQDEATSVVWGMPGAVSQAGLCTAVLPLTSIAPHLAGLGRP